MIVITYEIRDADGRVTATFKREFNTTLEQYEYQRRTDISPYLSLVAVKGEFKDE